MVRWTSELLVAFASVKKPNTKRTDVKLSILWIVLTLYYICKIKHDMLQLCVTRLLVPMVGIVQSTMTRQSVFAQMDFSGQLAMLVRYIT